VMDFIQFSVDKYAADTEALVLVAKLDKDGSATLLCVKFSILYCPETFNLLYHPDIKQGRLISARTHRQ